MPACAAFNQRVKTWPGENYSLLESKAGIPSLASSTARTRRISRSPGRRMRCRSGQFLELPRSHLPGHAIRPKRIHYGAVDRLRNRTESQRRFVCFLSYQSNAPRGGFREFTSCTIRPDSQHTSVLVTHSCQNPWTTRQFRRRYDRLQSGHTKRKRNPMKVHFLDRFRPLWILILLIATWAALLSEVSGLHPVRSVVSAHTMSSLAGLLAWE